MRILQSSLWTTLVMAAVCAIAACAWAPALAQVVPPASAPAQPAPEQTEEAAPAAATETPAAEAGTADGGGLAEAPAILDTISETLDTLSESIRKIKVMQWISAFAAILGGLVLQRIIIFVLRRKALVFARKTRFTGDEVFIQALVRPVSFLALVFGVIFAGLALGLQMGEGADKTVFGNAVATLLVFNGAWIAFNLVDFIRHVLQGFADRTDTALDDQLVPLISKALKILVILLAVVTLGGWVGGPFKGVLAGLGIGGLAFALAAKDTVANLFGYVVIFLDRPFVAGDRVQIMDTVGDIEDVGMRSTKIRTLDKTLVSLPNSEIAIAKIENYSRRSVRLVDMVVGLTYETDAEQMVGMVEAIGDILAKTEGVEPDTCVVRFTDFGGSSLDIRVWYYSQKIRFAEFLELRETVNLAIMRAVAERGLSIAFPTRTLYVRQDPDGEPVFGRERVDSA